MVDSSNLILLNKFACINMFIIIITIIIIIALIDCLAYWMSDLLKEG